MQITFAHDNIVRIPLHRLQRFTLTPSVPRGNALQARVVCHVPVEGTMHAKLALELERINCKTYSRIPHTSHPCGSFPRQVDILRNVALRYQSQVGMVVLAFCDAQLTELTDLRGP